MESDISSTFSDDEDKETPEFIPSAWDKFAMPIKSALRSPEKTLNNKKTNVSVKVYNKFLLIISNLFRKSRKFGSKNKNTIAFMNTQKSLKVQFPKKKYVGKMS